MPQAPGGASLATLARQLDQNPIFVVGFPRSGTTLMQSMLSSMPGVATFPETFFFTRYRQVDGKLVAADPARPGLKEAFEREVARQLLRQHDAAAIPGLRWLEKTPDHADTIDEIRGWYPRARFVFMLRHPALCFASRRSVNEGQGGWQEGWKPVEHFAGIWQRYLLKAENMAEAHPESIRIVRLEDLVADEQAVMRALCEFLSLPFDAAALAARSSAKPAHFNPGDAWMRDVSRPTSAAVAAREGGYQLSPREQFRVGKMLGAAMRRHGYAVAPKPPLPHTPEDLEVFAKTRAFAMKEKRR